MSVPAARGDSPADQTDSAADMARVSASLQAHEYSHAFSLYLDALIHEPDNADASLALLRLMAGTTPLHVSVDSLKLAPAQVLPFSVETSPTEAPPAPPDSGETHLFLLKTPLPVETKDPRQDWPFDDLICVYRSVAASPAVLVADIHYQLPDDQRLAERTGKLLALLDRVYQDKLARPRADDNQPFHVWLCRQAPVSNGGEQWQNNIYFYDVADPRSSIEWIREIAHEFSHLAFPPVGGDYTEPESWANGYLGERLLARWLSRGAGGGAASVQQDWGETFAGYANFDRLLVRPALASFQGDPLDPKRLAARDADGMRYLIGMMLTVDDRCGSKAVGDLLGMLADQHQTDPSLLLGPASQLLHRPSAK